MNKLFIFVLPILVIASCNVKEQKSMETPTVAYLPSPTQSPSGEPYLFSDTSGTYLSWIEKKETESTLNYSKLTGDQWSAPIMMASGKNWFVNWADYPVVVTNGKEFVAHYLDKSGESTYAYDIQLISSQDGKIWSAPSLLHNDGKQAEHGFVSIVPYGENFFVSWLDGRNTAMEGMDHQEGHHGEMTVRAAILNKEGRKITEWELDNRVCDCCQTSATITNSGPVVVYRDRSSEEIRDMSIVRWVGNQWTEPKSIHPDNWKIAGCPVNGPRVVALNNSLAIAWFSMPEGEAQVNVIFSDDGGATFGKPIRIDEGKAIGRVDIVLLEDGNAMVSWMEGPSIKVVEVKSSGEKEVSLTIASSSDSRSSGFPQMTKSKDRLLFAWTDDKEKIIKTASLPL